MNDVSQQLEREIVKKNTILNSFNPGYNFDREQAHNIELELDGLLYQYYKRLKYKAELKSSANCNC